MSLAPTRYDPDEPRRAEVYPETEADWRTRYHALWLAYLNGDYSEEDAKTYHLFRALDDEGKVIDLVRRTMQFYRFIVDTDVRGLLGSDEKGPKLEVSTTDAGLKARLLTVGEALWRRSEMATWLTTYARMTAALGDYYLEAVRTSTVAPYGVEIVGRDARICTPTYDSEGTGRRLIRLVIEFDVQEPVEQGADGVDHEPITYRYRRVLDETNVEEWRRGKSEGAKPHYLGCVPAVHLRWTPWDQPEHSLPAPHGLDNAITRLDSLVTQMGAVANRYGNPTLVLKGVKLDSASDIAKFGRVVSGIPSEGDAFYLEAGAQALAAMLEWVREIVAHVEKTSPEFLFTDSGAAESGEARSYRASAFEAKIIEARSHIFPALAKITGIGVAMEARAAYDGEAAPFCIDASPVLPRNVKAELELLELASKWLKAADIVRHLQRLGLIGAEEDPETYAREVGDETADRAAVMFAETGGGVGGKKPKPAVVPNAE